MSFHSFQDCWEVLHWDMKVKQCRVCVAKSGTDPWPSRLSALIAVRVFSQVLPLCVLNGCALGTRDLGIHLCLLCGRTHADIRTAGCVSQDSIKNFFGTESCSIWFASWLCRNKLRTGDGWSHRLKQTKRSHQQLGSPSRERLCMPIYPPQCWARSWCYEEDRWIWFWSVCC